MMMLTSLRQETSSECHLAAAASPRLHIITVVMAAALKAPPPDLLLLFLWLLLCVTRCVWELNWPSNPPFHLSPVFKRVSFSLLLLPDELQNPDVLQTISC